MIRNIETREDLARVVPAAFATAPAPNVSDKYRFISTAPVIDALEGTGFRVVTAGQSKARTLSGTSYAKHMIRFRQGEAKQVGDVFPEIVMRNAHDGTSTYRLDAGLFRLVCMNGMTVGDISFGTVRVRHTGKIVADMIDASQRVIAGAVKAAEDVQQWQRIELTAERIMSFAQQAVALRGATEDQMERVDLHSVITTRREEDSGNSLWKVFNRVQENLTSRALYLNRTPLHRRMTSLRPIQSAEKNVTFNKKLWDLAAQVAQYA